MTARQLIHNKRCHSHLIRTQKGKSLIDHRVECSRNVSCDDLPDAIGSPWDTRTASQSRLEASWTIPSTVPKAGAACLRKGCCHYLGSWGCSGISGANPSSNLIHPAAYLVCSSKNSISCALLTKCWCDAWSYRWWCLDMFLEDREFPNLVK